MKKLFAFITLVLLLFSCRKTLDRPNWDIDAYAPISYTQLRLQNAIPDSLISVGANDELKLAYRGNLISFKIDSLFKIPDTSTVEQFLLPFGSIQLAPGQVFFRDTQDTRYDLEDVELRFAELRSGMVDLQMESSIPEWVVFTFRMPYATLNGVPFEAVERIPPGSVSSPSSVTKTIDLSGYELDLRGVNRNQFNTLVTIYSAQIDPNGSVTTIGAGSFVRLRSKYSNIVPEYGRGYFGSRIEQFDGDDALDVFANLPEGLLVPERASLKFSILNQVGADFRLTINELTASSNTGSQQVGLQHQIIASPINLSRARDKAGGNYPHIAASEYTTTINQNNSNVTEFIGSLPKRIKYDMEVNLNPLGNVSAGNDFIYYNTGLEVNIDAEIPLKIQAQDLLLVDTTAFSVQRNTENNELDNVIGGNLIVHAENFYPLDALIQYYLYDSNFVLIDSLFSDEAAFVKGASPDANGRVSTPAYSKLMIPVDQTRINRIYDAQLAIIHARLNTVNQPQKLTFLNRYYLDLKLVGDIKYNVKIPKK